MKKQYRPKLDPKVDLAGATPEALVRALFRKDEPLPPRADEPSGGLGQLRFYACSHNPRK